MWCGWRQGFRVFGHQMSSPIATVRAVVDAGSVDESDPNLYGISHFAEHMFFKGTSEMNYRDINREISRLGQGNAYTSFGKTVYHIECLPENIEGALSLLTKLIFDSQFPEEEFEKERNVILEEHQAGIDNPYSYFYNQSLSVFFGDKAHPIIGTKDSIGSISRDDILTFTKDHHLQSRIAFIVVGNIEKEDVKACCDKVLDQYKNIPDKYYKSNYIDTKNSIVHQFDHTSKQTLMGIYFNTDAPSQWKESRYVSLLFEKGFGDGGFSYNMLYDRIREQLGLCYSIGTHLYTFRGVNTIMVVAAMDGKNFEIVRDETMKVLEHISKNGFEDDLFELAKKSLIYDLISRGATPSYYAVNQLDSLFHVPFIDISEVRNCIESLSNEDIKKCAKKVLDDGFAIARMN